MDLDRALVAAWLNKLPFVRWDRLVDCPLDGGQRVLAIYGWIGRDDGKADFVLMEFGSWAEYPSAVTSSADRTDEINRLLYGEGELVHVPCQRVEDYFGPLVANAISLD